MTKYERDNLNHCDKKGWDNEQCIVFFLQMGISSERANELLTYL